MQVSPGLDVMTRFVHGMKPLWIEAGRLESAVLAGNLKHIRIEQPIFIGGLARSGSTVILEFIAAHPEVATHQYRDFPFIFTPYFSRYMTAVLAQNVQKKERAHGDGIFVSPYSPEAMEEMLWRAFKEHGDAFAAFYTSHIKKLLLAAHASRYAAKNNNLLTRLPTLLGLFPDARIIIPLRDPVSQIGSLVRQHRRFMEAANHPRAIRHLQAQGHDEFGPTRSWQAADEISGWIEQWNRHYGAVVPYLGRENILLVPFAGLCTDPQGWLRKIEAHAQLKTSPGMLSSFAARMRTPDYYEAGLSQGAIAAIEAGTGEINTILTKSML